MPLRQRLGVGTLCNVVLIGLVIDAVLAVAPEPQLLGVRAACLVAGIAALGFGSGHDIGAGLGPGPPTAS